MPHPLDELAPEIARWLAPHIARELGIEYEPSPTGHAGLDYFDEDGCAEYVAGLGTKVLGNAATFFIKVSEGEVDSVALADELSLSTPRLISSTLTNSLKKRSKALGIPRPWRESENSEGRTTWTDSNGIANRMVAAIEREIKQRANR
jgi:hypothetical protein